MDFVTFSKSKHVMLRSDLPDNRQQSHQAMLNSKQEAEVKQENQKCSHRFPLRLRNQVLPRRRKRKSYFWLEPHQQSHFVNADIILLTFPLPLFTLPQHHHSFAVGPLFFIILSLNSNPYPTLRSFKTSLFLLAAVELQRSHRRGADRPAGGSIGLTMTLTLMRTLTLTMTLTLAKRIMTTNSRLTCLDTCSQVRLQEIWRDRREELSVGLGRVEQVICSNLINIANINNG